MNLPGFYPAVCPVLSKKEVPDCDSRTSHRDDAAGTLVAIIRVQILCHQGLGWNCGYFL